MSTILEKFLKYYPNAKLDKKGMPILICPDVLDQLNNKILCDGVNDTTDEQCRQYWNQFDFEDVNNFVASAVATTRQ